MIGLTFDTDWATEEVLADTLRLLSKYGRKATFFATNDSPLLKASGHEVGIHPHFLEGTPPLQTLRALLDVYPAAIGVRSHKLVESTTILQDFMACGLKYDTNLFLPDHTRLRPVTRLGQFVRIPYFWGDQSHFAYSQDWDVSALNWWVPGLRVYSFHPIHIYLNTASPEQYLEAHPHYHDIAALEAYRHKGQGTRTIFEQLLQKKLTFRTCRDIYNRYMEAQA